MQSPSRSGWPRGRGQWLVGAVVVLALGALFGLILGNVWLGLALGAVVAIGWLIAYESWRGRSAGLDDPDDDGARL